MTVNDLSADDGWSIVEGIWETVLHAGAFAGDPDAVLHDPLTASVALAGAPMRVMTFTCGRSTGEAVARTMLALEDDEAVTDEDVEDAAGEVVNILGGNVKSVLDGATRLGLPNVVPGGATQTGDALWRTSVEWAGHVAQVALWRQDSSEDRTERMAAR